MPTRDLTVTGSPPNAPRPLFAGAHPSTIRFVRFDHLDVAFDDRVIEPRPWTALQSVWAADLSTVLPDGPMLELCSGAGHIGLAAAQRCGRRLVQVDADPTACGFAAVNARAAGIADRVEIRCASLDDAIRDGETFPLVVADPPYLRTDETARYPEDPMLAIDGGEDGLDVVRASLRAIVRALRPGGAALLQLRGRAQAEQLRPQLPAALRIDDIRTDGPQRAVVLLVREGVGR